MTLENIALADRKKLTSHFPTLLVGANSAGKTFAVENLPDNEKARTAILNFDIKAIGTGVPSEFYKVYNTFADSESIDKQLSYVTEIGIKFAAENKEHPALPGLREQMNHLNLLKSTSFFIDDIEAPDKIVQTILTLGFDSNVDRIVTDTLTALTDFCEAWANQNFSGREIWAQYGKAHQRILQALKEATIFCYKYVYIMAHHDYIPPAQYAMTPKQAVKVKGGIMSGNVEAHFNTVVFAYMTADGDRVFEANSANPLDTSRTKAISGKFSFVRNSLDDLEQIFAGTKTVVDGRLVEV